jgi:hypothetical protein
MGGLYEGYSYSGTVLGGGVKAVKIVLMGVEAGIALRHQPVPPHKEFPWLSVNHRVLNTPKVSF